MDWLARGQFSSQPGLCLLPSACAVRRSFSPEHPAGPLAAALGLYRPAPAAEQRADPHHIMAPRAPDKQPGLEVAQSMAAGAMLCPGGPHARKWHRRHEAAGALAWGFTPAAHRVCAACLLLVCCGGSFKLCSLMLCDALSFHGQGTPILRSAQDLARCVRLHAAETPVCITWASANASQRCVLAPHSC